MHLQIEGLAHDLRGISRDAGKTVFVDNALPGEDVIAKVERSSGRYIDARAVKINNPSVERQEPRCQHFARCGGCSLQYLDSERQIYHKQHAVLDQLQRFANIQPLQLISPLLSEPFGYRCRARLAVYFHRKEKQLLVGFREARGRQVVHLSECPILAPELENLLLPLQELLIRLDSRDMVSHIDLALSEHGRCVLLRHLKPFSANDLQVLEQFASKNVEQLFLQPGDTDSVHCFWNRNGETLLRYKLAPFELYLDYMPVDFTQVNPHINRKMVLQAMEWLQLAEGEVLLDLYCGLGNFSLPIASRGVSVIGVEGNAAMVSRATENARALSSTSVESASVKSNPANSDSVRFVQADLSCKGALKAIGVSNIDKIILDPPRAGAAEIIHDICDLHPRCILYISCDSATLARDAARVTSRGYQLQRFGVMDMFPQTTHVESMALFTRN